CPSPFGRGWRRAPGEGENAEMSRRARPHPALFLRLRPIGLALSGHLLPKGEGHARGFSLVNVLNSYFFLYSVAIIASLNSLVEAVPPRSRVTFSRFSRTLFNADSIRSLASV